MRSRLVLPALTLALAVGGGGEATSAGPTDSSAKAWAVRVVVHGVVRARTPLVVAPPESAPVSTSGFSWPADGSIVAVGTATAGASTKGSGVTAAAVGKAVSVSIFGGEITANSITANLAASASEQSAHGSFDGTGAVNVTALGKPVKAARVTLESWGVLTLDNRRVDTSAPTGSAGFSGAVTGLDVYLTEAHDGLPAGSDIQLGYAEVAVQTPTATPVAELPPAIPGGPHAGDRPQLLPPTTGPLVGVPQVITPPLTAGPYVFPVYGRSRYSDTFGDSGSEVTWHHGEDLFGQLGQPVVAVADGTVFSLGWNKSAGNKLRLRDGAGNEFSYADLAAFSILTFDGAHVKAGQVIGFMGDTGDEGGKTHLHFEVHPVSLLFLGEDGAVDPSPYLADWKRLEVLPFPVAAGWAPTVAGAVSAPLPGAILIGSSDISSADGLVAGSLRRALVPPKPARAGRR